MSFNAGEVYALLGGKFNPAGFAQFDGAMKKSGANATAFEQGLVASNRRSSASMTALGTAAKGGAAVGVGALGLAVVKSVGIFADYEQRLSGLKAVSGATGAQMKKLEGQARDLGKSTAFSAREVVQAQTELVKGGLSVEQVLTGGVAGALALAAAGEMELADAATTVANALNVFKLEGEDAGHVADVLAQAANNTTGDVSDFSMALAQGGAAAKLAGLSFDQTIVALEALAMSGVKGSDAGTSLKAALTQVANPSKESAAEMKRLGIEMFDSEGKIKSVSRMSTELRDGLKGMSEEQRLATLTTIAGTDGMRALAAVYDIGAKGARELGKSHKEVGTAADVARTKQDNLKGDVEKLTGAAEEAALQLGGTLGPALREGAQEFTDAITELVESGELENVGKQLAEKLEQGMKGVSFSVGAVDDVLAAYDEIRNFDVAGIKPIDLGLDITTNPAGALIEHLGELKSAAQEVGPAIGNGITSGLTAAADKVLGLVSTMLGALADVAEAGNDITPGSFGDVDTSGVRDAQKELDELRERTRNPLGIKFQVDSSGQRRIEEMVKQLADLGKRDTAIKITSNAKSEGVAVAAMAAVLMGVPEDVAVSIASNARSERVAIAAFDAVLAGVPASTVASVITNARSEAGAVSGLQAQINGVHGKSVTINVGVAISGSGKALKAIGWASGRHASGEREAGLVGEGRGPEWLVDGSTGRARKTTGPEFVGLGPNDYVIPTEPRYADRGRGLLAMLAADLGIDMYAGGKAPKGAKKPAGKKKPARSIPSQRAVFRDSPDDLERVADNADRRVEDARRVKDDKVREGKRKGKLTKEAQKARRDLPTLLEDARKRRRIAQEARKYADRIEAADEQANIARNDMELADRKDDQKKYDAAKKRRGSAIGRSVELLRAALKHAPKGSAWARALQKQLGDAQIGADDNKAETMDVTEPEETEAAKAAREAAERLSDTGMTDAERAQLAELEKGVALAALTETLDDDKSAGSAKLGFLETVLGLASSDPARGGAPAITSLAEKVKAAREDVKSFSSSTATNQDSDVQAQIDQAREAGYAAGMGGRIDAASAGVFGGRGGGVTVNVNALHPADSSVYDAIGAAATRGIGQQPYRRSSREVLGV